MLDIFKNKRPSITIKCEMCGATARLDYYRNALLCSQCQESELQREQLKSDKIA